MSERLPPQVVSEMMNDYFTAMVDVILARRGLVQDFIGEPVNLMSRIEGLNRELGTGILITGAALAVLKDRVVVRDRGSVTVKDRSEPVEISELLSLKEA